MKTKLVMVAAFAAAGFASTPALAQQQGPGFYAGASIGQAKAKDACDGASGPGISCDDKDTAWKVFGGYQINRNFAAELGYSDFGKFKASAGPAKATEKANAWDLVGVGILPLGKDFSLYGKAGIYRAEAKAKVSGGGLSGSDKDTSTDVTFGGGARYDVTPAIGLRVEWQRYSDVGGDDVGKSDVDVVSAGLQFRF